MGLKVSVGSRVQSVTSPGFIGIVDKRYQAKVFGQKTVLCKVFWYKKSESAEPETWSDETGKHSFLDAGVKEEELQRVN